MYTLKELTLAATTTRWTAQKKRRQAAGGRWLEDDCVEVWHTSESPSRLSPVTGTSAYSNSLADERAHEDQ